MGCECAMMEPKGEKKLRERRKGVDQERERKKSMYVYREVRKNRKKCEIEWLLIGVSFWNMGEVDHV